MTADSGIEYETGRTEAGFTLVEALIAMVVLTIGLTAVFSLFSVAMTSNAVANQATAATALASQQLEDLKAISFNTLAGATGGNLDTDVTDTAGQPTFRYDNIPGVGRIRTAWTVTPLAGDSQVLVIAVQSEGVTAAGRSSLLVGRRSRAQYMTIRSCTSRPLGCPAP